MPMQPNPYEIFRVLERKHQLGDIPLSSKERCQRLWEFLKSRWEQDLAPADLQAALKSSRADLKAVCGAVFHSRYQQSSRARWLCVLKTLLRIDCGILAVLLYHALVQAVGQIAPRQERRRHQAERHRNSNSGLIGSSGASRNRTAVTYSTGVKQAPKPGAICHNHS